VGRWNKFAKCKSISWDDSEKAKTESGGDCEEPGLVLRDEKCGHRQYLPCRADQYGGKAADVVRDSAPNLSAQKSRAEQYRQHHCANRAADVDVAAKGNQMTLRHRHRNTAQHCGAAHHSEHQIGRPSKHTRRFAITRDRRGRMNNFWWRTEINHRQRNDYDNFRDGVPNHRLAPADSCDGTLEYWRPPPAGKVAAAGNQR